MQRYSRIQRMHAVATVFAMIGVLIACAEVPASQPGWFAWLIVMAFFGVIFGAIGANATHVSLASLGGYALTGAAWCFYDVQLALEQATYSALTGAIAGGLFRPWLLLGGKGVSAVAAIARWCRRRKQI